METNQCYFWKKIIDNCTFCEFIAYQHSDEIILSEKLIIKIPKIQVFAWEHGGRIATVHFQNGKSLNIGKMPNFDNCRQPFILKIVFTDLCNEWVSAGQSFLSLTDKSSVSTVVSPGVSSILSNSVFELNLLEAVIWRPSFSPYKSFWSELSKTQNTPEIPFRICVDWFFS